MQRSKRESVLLVLVALLSTIVLVGRASADPTESAAGVVQKILDSDFWGFSGAEIVASFKLTDKQGTVSTINFVARSRRYDAPFSKSLVRFTAPPDLAGAGFLQVQNRNGDDDRMLFLPDLKRARRVAGNLRKDSFMGTDFSFADIDRRDLREGTATMLADEDIGRFPCFHLQVVTTRDDSPYGKEEIWARKDNYVPLTMKLFARNGQLMKIFTVLEVKRISGVWFISRSKMENVMESHSTELNLEQIVVTDQVPDEEFTVRALEKI